MFFKRDDGDLSDRKANEEAVIDYYDIATKPYLKFWGEFFHPAFFENDVESYDTAFKRTHDLFLQDSHCDQYSSIIDLGCGVGSLSLLIAPHVNSVRGITLSDFQVREAHKRAKSKGITNVKFEKRNILDIVHIKKEFDAAFYLDVGCYLPDKKEALKQIFSVLKPGGRVIIADWLQKEKPNSFERELLLDPFNHFWRYPYMESVNGYKKLFKQVGFKTIKAEDVSEKTTRNWNKMYDVAISEISDLSIKKMFGYISNPKVLLQPKKFIPQAKMQFYANYFVKICHDAGVFRYGYFVLEKPKK